MQSEILATRPQAKLRVYAIWTSKLFGDARDRWDAAGLTDRRVVHLWDGGRGRGGGPVDRRSGGERGRPEYGGNGQ